MSSIIEGAVNFAVKLVNIEKYNSAKEIFDIVLKTIYRTYNVDYEEINELSLCDVQAYDLISINIPMLCSYIIYIILQTSSDREKEIYNYFKNFYEFKDVSIENSFDVGSERVHNIDEFFDKWIKLLSTNKGGA